MASESRCHCQSCTIRSLTGPAIVITIGVLFLLHQLRGGIFYFGHTWPVLLLVVGILQLASAMASREGHIITRPPFIPPSTQPSTPPSAVPPPSSPVPPDAGASAPYSAGH